MIDGLRAALESDPRVAFALLFGSRARGTSHPASDVDVAIGLTAGPALDAREVGDLLSRLEAAAGGAVDLVILEEAGPGVAYRAFRDGELLLCRDRPRLVERKARAILEYLDWKPVEELFTRAALEAGRRG